MEEALEQAIAIATPVAAGAGNMIDLEHRGLQRRLARAVATVPLGRHGEAGLALTVVRREPYEVDELTTLTEALAGVAGAVRWMQRADRPWHRRAADAVGQVWARWRHADARWKRVGAAAAVLAVLLLGTIPVDDRVHGLARIEGEQQRVLAAPADGFVKTAHVRPGDVVRAGDVLLDLVDADLRLERDRWSAQVAQHENAYAAAMAKSERSAAATAIARAAEAQAQLELAEGQLARGRLVAPFDAIVIQGDWLQSAGAPVRQGDALLTLATQGRLRIVVEVDEVDIARVRVGQPGTLALSGWALRDEPLVVERIAPMAKAVNGRNVFEVEARLNRASTELRPGLVGRGALSAGRSPWLWSTARDAWLRIRLTAWRWWG
jgi:multidrug efflux pump subunit AcrA (membrane-fusion protein)